MANNKNQHYVPQLYFRLFSEDQKRICGYNLKNKKYFYGPFKKQCSRDYFYGKNPVFDNFFKKFETTSSNSLHKLIEEKKFSNFSVEELTNLYIYLLFQFQRTNNKKLEDETISKYAIQTYYEMYQTSFLSRSNSMPPKDEFAHIRMILASFRRAPLAFDLKKCLLINNTDIDFIFSDSPVVFHNTFFNKYEFGSTGIHSNGLQIFMPLNNKLMLFLYDPNYYSLSSDVEVLNIKQNHDVDSLNSLQVFNCEENLYFKSENQIEYVISLHDKYHSKLNGVKIIKNVDYYFDEDRNEDVRKVHIYKKNIPYDLKLTFMENKAVLIAVPGSRNPELRKKVTEIENRIMNNEKFNNGLNHQEIIMKCDEKYFKPKKASLELIDFTENHQYAFRITNSSGVFYEYAYNSILTEDEIDEMFREFANALKL